MAGELALGRREPVGLLLVEGIPHQLVILPVVIGDHQLHGILETA